MFPYCRQFNALFLETQVLSTYLSVFLLSESVVHTGMNKSLKLADF